MIDYKITLLTSSDASTAETLRSLIEQLTERSSTFGEADLRKILQDNASRIFIMWHEGEIVGMLSLCTYLSPTARKVWVEDVVIDDKLRGRGLGQKLVDFAINYVRENLSPCSLMLTSRPSRVAANELYRKVGFQQRQTNIYCLKM